MAEWYPINPDLIINLEHARAFERIDSRNTRVYIEFGEHTSFDVQVPMDTIHTILKMRGGKTKSVEFRPVQKNVGQLQRFQMFPTP